MKALKVGDRCPEFSLLNQNGERITLSDFIGKKKIVLYFYPKDKTAICTKQACSFRDAYVDFLEAGCEVLGVSSDSIELHAEFVSEQHLPFDLLSDPDDKIRNAFGISSNLFGLVKGRVTFLIDEEGIIRYLFNSQFSAQKHVDKMISFLGKKG